MNSYITLLITFTCVGLYCTLPTPEPMVEPEVDDNSELLGNSTKNLKEISGNELTDTNEDLDLSFTNETEDEVRKRIENWKPESGGNVWELSGLLEGDIQVPRGRNGLRNTYARWPCGIVPYSFEYGAFNSPQTNTIYSAINEYHSRTCLRFVPRTSSDSNYIEFTSRYAGCWAPVGMQGGRQTVNLQSPSCVTYATAVHEILHAVGFYHSHSVSNRDSYVRINWNNIQQGQEHNFNKFGDNEVTDFGVPYDYRSILHYSSTAFSKNGYPTIESRHRGYTLGNANQLSSGDVEKVQRMYQYECSRQCRR